MLVNRLGVLSLLDDLCELLAIILFHFFAGDYSALPFSLVHLYLVLNHGTPLIDVSVACARVVPLLLLT